MIRDRRTWAFVALGWALLIIVFGTVPVQELIDATAGSDREAESTIIGHFAEYLILAMLLAAGLGGWRSRPRSLVLALALAVALGTAIEILQAFLPYRDCQATDVLVNGLGAATGLVLYGTAAAWRAKR